ncbi:MAG: hypothetical protein NWF07_05410 [Candidatus Bathyarchaeota archaeon]|nr:hypothetical protein [Candidatus Bathyarchaeota archaeon]
MKRQSLIIAAIIMVTILLYQGVKPTQKKAIIIDPINEESEFKTRSTNLLTENGYTVTYISGEEVTVKLLKNLPKDHDIYIFRVHSTCINNRTWIFSGEKYKTESHPLLQLADLVHRARPSLTSAYYFAVSPELIQQYNPDCFTDSIILMMGCEGLATNDMADAFCSEGASTYVSWDGNVCLEHTDQTILALLESLCIEKTSIIDAVNHAYTQTGADPVYLSVLKVYSHDT